MSRDSLEIRRLLAKGIVGQVADDESVAIRLKAKLETEVTSVTITTATDITVITGAGTSVYDFATYTTLGEVIDKINADGEFTARIIDGLRDIASASALVNGVITISDFGYYDALMDTSETNVIAYNLSLDRGVPVEKPINGHRIEIKEIVYTVTISAAARIRVYQVDAITGQVENILYDKAGVTAVETTINWAAGIGKISGDDGKDLIVAVVGVGGTVTGDLTASGYSV